MSEFRDTISNDTFSVQMLRNSLNIKNTYGPIKLLDYEFN